MPRTRKIKLLLIIAGLLIVCGAAFLSLGGTVFTQNYARGKISGALGARLGRDVSVEGPFDILWHWKFPRIHAEGVRIANAQGMTPPDMLRIAKIDFSVRLGKLLTGRLEIPDMRITRPELFLERRDEKTKNWEFPAYSEARRITEAVKPENRGDMPVIDALRISGGRIVYRDVPRKIDLALNVNTVRGHGNEAEETYSFTGKGTVEEHPFSIQAKGGSMTLLRDTRKPFPLALEARIGATTFAFRGAFEDPVKLEGLNAALRLKGDNLADLFYLMHIPFPPTPPYRLRGHLDKTGNIWTFTSFQGGIGHSDLSGDVIYNTEGRIPLLSGTLRSRRLDVADLGGLIGLSPAQKRDKSAPVLPSMPVDLDRLLAGNMNLRFTAEKMNAPGWPLSDMSALVRLKDGLLEMNPLRFGVADGTVTGAVVLDGRDNLPRARLDLQLTRLSLRRFFTGSAFDAFSKGYFGGRILLEGPGTTVGRILGNSDGRVVVVLSGGKISLLLMEAADLDLAELAPLVIGDDQTTDIRCGIGDFLVREGLLRSQVFVLDTTDTNIEGKAEIDLRSETIRAFVDAHPKDPSIFSLQSRILISGKLRKPDVIIDPLSIGLRGAAAAALGAIAPPAAILPFVAPGLGRDSDCEKLLRESMEPVGNASAGRR